MLTQLQFNKNHLKICAAGKHVIFPICLFKLTTAEQLLWMNSDGKELFFLAKQMGEKTHAGTASNFASFGMDCVSIH